MDLRTFAKSSGPPPNLPVPPGVIPNSVSQQLNNLRMTESSMSSMLRTQQEHARSLERMATMQRQIIEMQQIQTQQLHSMQQMMLPLAFQCNAFMSSMSSLAPGDLVWEICLLSRSHLSNQHWDRRGPCVILLMDYLEVVRDLWCSLLFYQLVRDLQCLLQVVRNPNVVVLISNQILFMSYKVLQAQFRFRAMVFTIM